MSIETIVTYRVSVIIPDDFYEQFGNTEEYEKAILSAVEGYVEAGQDRYSVVEEWATFYDKEKAIRCENMLNAIVANANKGYFDW